MPSRFSDRSCSNATTHWPSGDTDGYRTHQADVGLVHEAGGLQGVIGALVAEVGGGQVAHFLVDDRRQDPNSVLVARAPTFQ